MTNEGVKGALTGDNNGRLTHNVARRPISAVDCKLGGLDVCVGVRNIGVRDIGVAVGELFGNVALRVANAWANRWTQWHEQFSTRSSLRVERTIYIYIYILHAPLSIERHVRTTMSEDELWAYEDSHYIVGGRF